MRSTFILTIVLIIVQNSVAPPVNNDDEKKEDEGHKFKDFEDHDWEADPRGPPPKFDLHYQEYLKEVVDLLESDHDFKEKLRNATVEDLQTAKVAHELKFIDYNIRTKLDELKRRELERVRHYAIKEYELTNNITITADHMDMHNQHTFEVEDLKKLILRATKDMTEQDRLRREEFKKYEMNKKLEEERKLQGGLSEEERKKYVEELENMKKKHQDHKPLNHPGSKKQLEEVWEKEDHMDRNDFDPKTFFFMHDLDGNGFWDEDEVKALFLKELDKMYQQGAPEDDLVERAEEMERMREHVFSETDTDGNRLIDYQEFLKQTQRNEFENDPGWKPIDEQEIYTPDEYEAYKKEHEIKSQIVEGLFPSQPVQQDPNQVPQYQQPPQQQQQYQQPPQQQQQYQQPPQQQQYQQPPQQQQYQQPPQQYQQPPQQQQYQQPPQQQQYVQTNQIPVQQQYQGQVPQQQNQQYVQQNVQPNVNQQQNIQPNVVQQQQQQQQPNVQLNQNQQNNLNQPQQNAIPQTNTV
ncbi:nucleobindin-2 isoform X3 [Microplitis mediator]|uniref:nucleobindin-2 isoform X3 n=1 Tax=Microplitis mediator TaxID=375433 RepID=UPI002555F171|nr:nucleobindin-2 isoform X3 [Microplitis mediator]